MKNLRIIVIPTEEETGINQRSEYNEIVESPFALSYSLEDYCKAQNDEELPMHWSFLIDTDSETLCN